MGFASDIVVVPGSTWTQYTLGEIPDGFGALFVPIRRNGLTAGPTPQGLVLYNKDTQGKFVTDGSFHDCYISNNGGVFALYEPGRFWIYQTDSATIDYQVRIIPITMINALLPSGAHRKQVTQFTIAPATTTLIAVARPLRTSLKVGYLYATGAPPVAVWVNENIGVFGAGPNVYNGESIALQTYYTWAGDENWTHNMYCYNPSATSTVTILVIDNYNE